MAKVTSDRNVAQDAVRNVLTYDELESNARSLWAIATSGTKPEYSVCPKCGVRVKLDRVDLMARVNAQEKLGVMGWGKPKEDSGEMRGFVLNRIVVNPDMGDGV